MNNGKRNLFATPGRVSRSRSAGGQPKYSPLAKIAMKQRMHGTHSEPLMRYGLDMKGVDQHNTKKATTKSSPLRNTLKQGGKRKRKSRRKKRTRKHRGGAYSQYASNVAHSAGYSAPNTFGSQPWATGPVSKVRYVNSYDNYNHYKK